MESSHRLLLFFALLLVTLQSAHSQKVDLRPSKIILLPEDRNVTLQCIPSGLQDDPYNVVVITARDRTLYNSSETNKKGKYKLTSLYFIYSVDVLINSFFSSSSSASVSVINKTAIEYFDVAEGLSEVRCRINNTVSQEGTTIFAVGAVQLVHDAWNHSSTSPEQQQQQTSSGTSSNNNNEANNGNGTKSTLIRCPYSIQPNVTGVVLSLLVNGTEVGRFSPNCKRKFCRCGFLFSNLLFPSLLLSLGPALLQRARHSSRPDGDQRDHPGVPRRPGPQGLCWPRQVQVSAAGQLRQHHRHRRLARVEHQRKRLAADFLLHSSYQRLLGSCHLLLVREWL